MNVYDILYVRKKNYIGIKTSFSFYSFGTRMQKTD